MVEKRAADNLTQRTKSPLLSLGPANLIRNVLPYVRTTCKLYYRKLASIKDVLVAVIVLVLARIAGTRLTGDRRLGQTRLEEL